LAKCLAAKGRVLLSSKWNVTLTSANNEVLCAICSKFNLFHANEVKSHHKHSRNLYAGFWMVSVLLIYSNKTSQELLLILQNLQRYFQSSLAWDFSPEAEAVPDRQHMITHNLAIPNFPQMHNLPPMNPQTLMAIGRAQLQKGGIRNIKAPRTYVVNCKNWFLQLALSGL